MGQRNQIILGLIGAIIGIIFSAWIVLQVPHSDPSELAITGFIIILVLGLTGWKIGEYL